MKTCFLAGAIVVSLAPLQAAPPAATGTGWDLVFADEFTGTSVDTVKWNVASPSWTMPNSLATADASKVSVADGVLTLTATRPTSAASFNSGSVSTYQKNTFTEGYLEARILLPTTPGSWPAFWGLYNNWPPEADIMEYPLTAVSGNGYANTDYHTAFHYSDSGGNAASGAGQVNPASAGALNTGYHTFGMHWVKDTSVTFYFDGAQVSSFNNSAVAQMVNMYLILDYAVGGWPGTPSTTQWPAGFSDQTKVDWVRIWQQRPSGSSTTSTWKTNGGGTWTTSGNWTGIVPKYSGQQAVFPRVGNATTAAVDWSNLMTVGGVTFSGGVTTPAYTLSGDSLQLAGSGGTANAYVEALATSQANQSINSKIEFYNTTEIRNNMTGGQSIILNGQIIGGGGLILNGAGTVQFSNNNLYLGDTSIGLDQGAAVARVTRSNPFGTTGVVIIGPSGNATTARVEIQDNRTIPNAISLSGRTNTSAAIQNISGANIVSGTVSAQVGGSYYVLQSDAGSLTLSGAASNGVALRSAATGSRNFTLQGAGDGVVSGIIENGSGTVAVTKAGAGTWTLGGANTYTGATTVSAGTLAVNGSIASGGSVSIASGSMLKGSGSIAAATTINGTHAPGANVGTQSITGNLSYGATSHLSWDIIANATTAGNFDVVSAGAVTIGNGAKLDLVLNGAGSAVNFTDIFWASTRSWTLLTATSLSGSFALDTITTDAGGRSVASYGSFALQQSGNTLALVFTPTGGTPAPPTNVVAKPGDQKVILSWTASSGAASYAVLRSTTSGGPYVAVSGASALTATSFTDTTAVNGTTYFYVVTATNGSGTSGTSIQGSATPHALLPYPVDAKTLVLLHLNETGTAATANAGSLGGNAYSVNLTAASATPATVTTVLGAAGANALGTSANFAAGQLIGFDRNSTPPNQGYQGDVNGTTLSTDQFAMSTLNMGNGGRSPWTIEAMIYCTQAAPLTGINQEIICTDSSAGTRGFQFRLTAASLELNIIGNGTDIVTALPTSGAHAYAPNAWFHVAATYDGTNIKLYWTRADAGVTAANLLSTTTATVTRSFGTMMGPLCIGGENRAANGEYFRGRIDEVRISSVARVAEAMQPAWLDLDADGLPDEWERRYFANLSYGPNDNPDNDGYTNAQELTAGTDPDDPASNPSSIDFDDDQLPDAWEEANLLTLSYGAYDDPDGDTYNNLAELKAGTNPLNAASHPDWTSPRVTFLQDSVVTNGACLMPNGSAYGRAINGISFQDSILQTFNGYQYTAWYDTVGTTQTVWLARRTVSPAGVGAWEAFNTGSEFLNGDEGAWDAHNVIAFGICAADGTLHLAFDHHGNTLRYRRSIPGLCTTATASWGPGMLNAEQDWLVTAGSQVTVVTYPQFVATPSGGLVLNYRYGASGDGDQMLRTYIPINGATGGNWTAQNLFMSRTGTYQTSANRCAYINGLDFGPDGKMHVTWTWREGAGTSNHDICYAYSADNGTTWRNNAGTLIADTSQSQSISLNSAGIIIKATDLNQLLINQQSQAVDSEGRVHVLMLHRREDPGFEYPAITTASYSTVGTAYYHYVRDPVAGAWSQRRIPLDAYPVGSRPKIAYDAAGNVYAVFISYNGSAVVTPGYTDGKLVIASASKASQYTDWEIVQVNNTQFDGEPLIDQARLLSDNVLSVYIQEHSATTTVVATPLHVIDYGVSTTSLQTWRQQKFGPSWNNPAVVANTADPDGDGISNLLERAFGGNPNASEANLLPFVDTTSALLSVRYRKLKSSQDMVYQVQESNDLSPDGWTAAQGSSSVVGDDGTVQTIRFAAPPGTGRKFLRVAVTQP